MEMLNLKNGLPTIVDVTFAALWNEWSAIVAGHKSYGKSRLKARTRCEWQLIKGEATSPDRIEKP
jgi:hypothetical protein